MNKLSSTEVVAQNKEYVEARRKGFNALAMFLCSSSFVTDL